MAEHMGGLACEKRRFSDQIRLICLRKLIFRAENDILYIRIVKALTKWEFEEVGSLVGRITGLVCFLLCSFPFFVISIYDKDSSVPVNFWSGDTSLKDKVKNVKGYNTEMAVLYKKCALFFLLTGSLFAFFPVAGIVLLVFGCTVGFYLAYRVYKEILDRYS